MANKSLDDFRRLFWGTTDAEYATLEAAATAGVTAADLISVPGGTINPADGIINLQSGGVDRIQIDATGIGFFGKAPVARPAGTADPSPPSAIYSQAEAQSARNAIIAIINALESLGLIATT